MPITFISSAAHTKRLTAQWSFKHSAVMAALLMACCSAQAQNARMDEDPASDDAIELKTTYVRPEYVEIERLRETKEIIVIPRKILLSAATEQFPMCLKACPVFPLIRAGGAASICAVRAMIRLTEIFR